MGCRNDSNHGIAVNGKAEGTYMVASGTHVNNGCCFDSCCTRHAVRADSESQRLAIGQHRGPGGRGGRLGSRNDGIKVRGDGNLSARGSH